MNAQEKPKYGTPEWDEYRQQERARLEEKYGKDNVWDTDELEKRFSIQGFLAPFCVATERETGKKGVLTFQHSPRFYFDWRDERR